MTNANTADDAHLDERPSGASGTAADRLEAGVQALTVPEPLAEAETILLKAGIALPAIGLVLMLVAWWSASDTPYVADQIPMLISGGLVGLGLNLSPLLVAFPLAVIVLIAGFAVAPLKKEVARRPPKPLSL